MATLATLTVKILGDTGQLVSSLDRAQKRSKSFTDGLRKARGPLLAMTGAAVALGGSAVKAFGDFDQAMTQSLAIMDDVSDTMRNDMVEAAEEVGRVTTFSARDAAESYFFLASAGLDASSSIKALPTVAAFAQAGMFDMARATDLLTDAQSALGLTIKDDAVANMLNMVRVSDTLAKANSLANASVEQFSESLTNKAGAALRLVGKDVEEGVAVLAAFADQGVKGSEAGTQLGIVMRDLQTKALQNTREFKKQNIAVFDSAGEMRNFADILLDLENNLDGASDATKKQTLLTLGFSDKSVAALQAIIGTSDAIREYEAQLRSAGGATETMVDKQLTSFNSQMKIARDRTAIAATKLGSKLAPAVLSVVKALEKVVDMIAGFSDGTLKTLAGILLFVGALGALGLIIPPMVAAFGALSAIWGLMVTIQTLGAAAVWANVAAWIALNVATGGIILGIGLLITAIVLMATNFERTKEIAVNVFNTIMAAIETAVNFVIGKINGLIQAYNRTIGKVFGDMAELGEVSLARISIKSKEVFSDVGNDVNGYGTLIDEVMNKVGKRYSGTFDNIETDSGEMVEKLTRDITTLSDRYSGFNATRVENEQEAISKILFISRQNFATQSELVSKGTQQFIESNETKLRAFEIFSQGFMSIDDAMTQAKIENLEAVEKLRRENLEKEIRDKEELAKLEKDNRAAAFKALRDAVGLLPSVIRSNVNQGVGSFAGLAETLSKFGAEVNLNPIVVSPSIPFTTATGLNPDDELTVESFRQARRDADLGNAGNTTVIIEIHTPAVLGDNTEEIVADAVVNGVKRGLFPAGIFE